MENQKVKVVGTVPLYAFIVWFVVIGFGLIIMFISDMDGVAKAIWFVISLIATGIYTLIFAIFSLFLVFYNRKEERDVERAETAFMLHGFCALFLLLTILCSK